MNISEIIKSVKEELCKEEKIIQDVLVERRTKFSGVQKVIDDFIAIYPLQGSTILRNLDRCAIVTTGKESNMFTILLCTGSNNVFEVNNYGFPIVRGNEATAVKAFIKLLIQNEICKL